MRLRPLLQRSQGRPETVVGLIDGDVAVAHPEFSGSPIRVLGTANGGGYGGTCDEVCRHGTFVAGMLSARRAGAAPGICPGCTLLVRPAFRPRAQRRGWAPRARPKEELAEAINEVVDAGAQVVNLSLSVTASGTSGARRLAAALDDAAGRAVIVVVAAGNQGMLDTSVMTRHPGVIPVVSYSTAGTVMSSANLGMTIGRHGVGALGQDVLGLAVGGGTRVLSGSSAAAAFVTGTIALLRSEFPSVPATVVRYAVVRSPERLRRSVVPPLLDAMAAYQAIRGAHGVGVGRAAQNSRVSR
ncbi:S8 family peptidase [Actinopolymorpha pittospori]